MKKVIGLIVAGLIVLACFIGAMSIATGSGRDAAQRVTPTTYGPPKAPAVKAGANTFGDETVHVGEDVAPGTYRLRDAVAASDNCYWAKSTDAEGADIIANDLGSAGRLQVTLKKGQWFESRNCGVWAKK